MNTYPSFSWNTNGLIVEGIAGTGKTTAIRALLASEAWTKKGYISSIVLSEHQTMRVLEAKERQGTLRVEDHIKLLSNIVSMIEQLDTRLSDMDWLARGRDGHKLPFLFERFHFTHVYHYPDVCWQDVQGIDQRLAALNTKVCILTIDLNVMKQRIIGDTKKNSWKTFLNRFGEDDAAIIQHFIQQQETLLRLSQQTCLPCHMIDTSNSPTETVVGGVLDFWRVA